MLIERVWQIHSTTQGSDQGLIQKKWECMNINVDLLDELEVMGLLEDATYYDVQYVTLRVNMAFCK